MSVMIINTVIDMKRTGTVTALIVQHVDQMQIHAFVTKITVCFNSLFYHVYIHETETIIINGVAE